MMLFHLMLATATPMPTVLLNNGVEMPAVAAGTWQYSSTVAGQSVTAALSVGLTHIDTAHDYCADGSTAPALASCAHHGGGSNQQGISTALAATSRPRSSLFITTKVPACGSQGMSRAHCTADTLKAAQQNLDELNVTYVDLLLIHFPPVGGCGALNCGLVREQWRALTQIYKANKTRAVGVSNWCISCFECLAKDADALVPAVNQVSRPFMSAQRNAPALTASSQAHPCGIGPVQFQFHIGMGADPGGLISYCKSKGVVPQAYSPLGDNTKELIDGPLVTEIGSSHNKSGVQVRAATCLAWHSSAAPSGRPDRPSSVGSVPPWGSVLASARGVTAQSVVTT